MALGVKPAGADCQNCPRKDEVCVLPESSVGKPKLVVLGESPGRQEADEGKPFVGASGRVMNNVLKRTCNLRREDIWWTNSILCWGSDKTLAAARKACSKRLKEEVEALDADVILALGGYSLQSALGISRKPSILNYRGSVIDLDDPLRGQDSIKKIITSTTHPAFVMRAPAWAPVFEADVARAGRLVHNGYTPPEKLPGKSIFVVQDFKDLGRLNELDKDVIVDIETVEASGHNKGKGPDIHTNRMTSLVIADTSLSIVIPWSKTLSGQGAFFNGHQPDAVKLINECLHTRIVATHNGPAYDHTGLKRHGIILNEWDDTMLAYHVVTSHFPKRLEHVVACYVDAPPWKKYDHAGSLDLLWEYNGRDGLYNALAKVPLFASMDEDERRVYESDKRSAIICREMSSNGFLFDREHALEISQELSKRELELAEDCQRLSGMPSLNVLSGKQLAHAFFQKLTAHVCFRTESGAPSLGKDALRAYAASANEKLSEMALKVIELRSVRKCRSTYVDKIKTHEDGRVRPTWMSTGTVSGRWSCKGPNLANLPKPQNDASRDLGGIRSLYIAPEGRLLVAFDVKQMEFRIAAYLSGDPNMMASCAPGEDVHWMNARSVFGIPNIPYDSKNREHKEKRDISKNFGFACCYLADTATVHSTLTIGGMDVSFAACEASMGKMRRAFRVYFEFQAEALNKVIRDGYVASPILKRKRWLGHAPKPPEVANFPIQAGAADAMNEKCWKILSAIKAQRLDAFPVAMVYDALYIESSLDDVEKVEKICQDVFDEPIIVNGREFVLPIDLHHGKRWSEI